MIYHIVLSKVDYDDLTKTISNRKHLMGFIVRTETSAYIDVLYDITLPQSKLSQFLQKNQEDGHYQLALYRQAISGRMQNLPVFRFVGWHLINKIKDAILTETKYMSSGFLNPDNLEQRDIQEEVRRTNDRFIPETLEEDKLYDQIDPRNDAGKVITYTDGDGGVVDA